MARLSESVKLEAVALFELGHSKAGISNKLGIANTTIGDFLRKDTHKGWWEEFSGEVVTGAEVVRDKHIGPKVLTLDIETKPLEGYFWAMYNNNLSLSQMLEDWYILSWAAKWGHEDRVIYQDKSGTWDDASDKDLLQDIWSLLDEADFIVTQNGIRFDQKKLNARFILNGMKKPSSYRHIDTLKIAKETFGFTSNKLEYMTDKLCKKYKKLKHKNFPGQELWNECLKGNGEAWDEMEEYNIHDVLSTEELYTIIAPWYKKLPNFNLYYDDLETRCSACGGVEFVHNGYDYTNLSKFDRFQCTGCGHEHTNRVNLLSKEKRQSLKRNIN